MTKPEQDMALEQKYIEERVTMLKALVKEFGPSVLNKASEAKQELERKRVFENYASEIPVPLDRYTAIAFEDFENIDQQIKHEVLSQTESKLVIKVSSCNYCTTYRHLGAEEIGKAFVCNMDVPITQALNPDFKLRRPSRMMDGDPYCIFEVRL